jgi:hypothetical protein
MTAEALELLARVVLHLLVWLLLWLAVHAVATPFILLSAPFRPQRVRSDYAAVRAWLDEWGPRLV